VIQQRTSIVNPQPPVERFEFGLQRILDGIEGASTLEP
jgi:hypothetical protein